MAVLNDAVKKEVVIITVVDINILVVYVGV